MKNSFVALSAYSISFLTSISFFIILFKILAFNYFIGMAIVSMMVLVSVMLIMDKDFIQDAEEATF